MMDLTAYEFLKKEAKEHAKHLKYVLPKKEYNLILKYGCEFCPIMHCFSRPDNIEIANILYGCISYVDVNNVHLQDLEYFYTPIRKFAIKTLGNEPLTY